jgi:hypothetical protein
MRYDAAHNPNLNDVSGSPIYTITSTGRVGAARRTVVAEVLQKPYQVQAKGALVVAVPITNLGNANVCGYDHLINTPYDDGNKGRGAMPGDADHCIDNENTLLPAQPGVWGTDGISPGGNAASAGNPDYLPNQGQPAFYSGPWDCFSMSQSDFWSLVGAPRDPSAITDWKGVYNVDNNGVTRDQSCSLSPNGADGEGFLYVDGDLNLNSNFHYKGLIFVEGDFKINGNAWVLGGIVVKGKTEVKSNGTMTILYSSDAITQMLSKYGGQFVTLNWREK